MTDLRLLIIAPDPLARAGLATLLTGRPGYSIVGQLGIGETLPAEVDTYRPDVIVWDLGWEPEESLDLLGELEAETLVALLPDDEHIVAAWNSGARGLLPRDVNVEQLLAGVTAVFNGLATVDPAFLDRLLPVLPAEAPLTAEELTPRELEVLQLLAEGLANKNIAQQLQISEHTVKFHVNAIMGKLEAQSRTEAVVRATRLGLIVL